MEIIIYVLMLFIALQCAFKLSLWPWAPRIAYSVVLAAFVWWSQRYAILQSKTQLADWLHDVPALQNMAVIVTLESVCGFAFVAAWLGGAYAPGRPRWWQRLLWWYPSLLLFPVMFYVLTQAVFTLTGTGFGVTAAIVAAVAAVVPPLLAGGVRVLLPDADSRVELLMLLTCFVCVMGLISTETGKMVYAVKESPVDLRMLAVSAGGFILMAAIGYAAAALRWKLRK